LSAAHRTQQKAESPNPEGARPAILSDTGKKDKRKNKTEKTQRTPKEKRRDKKEKRNK